ncbi:MAG: copper resistance protein CopC, partial [Conexibacter sp.]|nr:copper resistance protein CopC [Conexibacter sp.]
RTAELGATGLALPRSRRGAAGPVLAVLALPAAYLLLMPGLSGHGASQSPVAVLLPANVVHVTAMSVWVGGLAVLLLGVPAATRRLEPAERGRLLAAVLVRFSPLALGAVIAILLTGLVQSYVLVRTPAHLLDTAFGRAALIKFLLLLALIGLGAYQRRRSLPRLRRIAAEGASLGASGVLLRRALRGELALIVVVLGVTAALTGYAPSIAAQRGPFSTTTTVGPAQLQLTLDPVRVGSNELHLYLLNPRDGSQFTGAREVDVAETQPQRSIGPLQQQANVAGPGHYVIPAATFGVPGTWQLQVTVRVSDFDEYTRKLEVKIR